MSLPHSAVGPETRIKGHPAVDVESCPDDVIGVVAGKPDRRTGHVFRLADAAIRNERHQPVVGLLGLPGGPVYRRPDRSRSNRIDPDPVRSDLLRQAAHHQIDAALGGGVVYVARPRNFLVDGAHANDLSRRTGYRRHNSAPSKLGDGLTGAEELSRQVDGQHLVPLLQRHAADRGIPLEPGIRDQYVDRAELLAHALEHAPDIGLYRNVGLVCRSIHSETADFRDGLVRLVRGRDIVDEYVGTRLAESDCDGPTNSRARTRDKCLLSSQGSRVHDANLRIPVCRYLRQQDGAPAKAATGETTQGGGGESRSRGAVAFVP